MFVKKKYSQDKRVEAWNSQRSFLGRLRSWLKRRWLQHRFNRYREGRPEGLELFSQARTVGGPRVTDAIPKADIYNLHWIRGFIDPVLFFRTAQQPVVWTLHDMNAFTGGCHYNVGCRRFEKSCGHCPQLGSTKENDLSRTVWARKKSAYAQAIDTGKLHVVAPSAWLAKEAKQSTLLSGASVYTIPYGIDHHTFHPRRSHGLRAGLEIPRHHRIILFVAQSAQNHRKGFDLLAEALSLLSVNDVTLLSIGGEHPDLETTMPHRHLGMIESDVLLSVFYSLSDLFVIPSRQDNLPNTVLESMACGTPVVGFDTGGISDMVRPGNTGWLAETNSARALCEKIEKALADDTDREWRGRQCRNVVEEEYTLKHQARKYEKLYTLITD